METIVESFAFNIINDGFAVCYIESQNQAIIKCEILDDRFNRILNFLLGEQTYEDIIFFLKSRTLKDAKKGNIAEIYESIQQNEGQIWTDPLAIEFVETNVSNG